MKKIDKSILFIIISVIFLLVSIIYYGVRLIHYYKLENPKKEVVITNLKDLLIKNQVYEGSGLYNDGEEYYFYGNNINNYLYYSGRMFRIMSIDKNGIKIVSNEPQTILYYGNTGYDSSYIKKYLDSYYETLNKEYIKETNYCSDTIDDTIRCEKKSKDKITTISLYDYKRAGDKDSYLNNNKYKWLLNVDSENNPWYISEDGTVSKISNKVSLGVNPVITLKNDIDIVSGSGSLENPYIIETINQGPINTMNIGSYVNYAGYTWKIIGIDNNVKLILKDDLNTMIYSYYNNTFETFRYNSVAHYLNNDFYNSLTNNSYIVDSIYYSGIYEEDFNSVKNNEISAKVGLPSVGDMIINSNTPYFTMTPTGEATQSIYVVGNNGRYIVSDINENYMVKPVITVLGSANVIGGVGTINNPLVLE